MLNKFFINDPEIIYKIFKDSQTPMAIGDLKGNIIDVNPEFCELLKYDESKLLQMKFMDINHPEDNERESEFFFNAIKNKKSGIKYEKRFITKEGKTIHVLFSGSIVYSDEKVPLFTIGQVLDISRSIEAEKKLYADNKMKNILFSMIAHDIRNPLSPVLALLNLMKDEKITKSELDELFQLLRKSLKDLNDLTQKLLLWSSSQFEDFEVKKEKINLYDLLEETISLFTASVKDKNIIIKNKSTPGHTIYADQNMTSTIIRNLISNAIKFSHENCEIIITSSFKENKTILHIKDSGIGITEELLDRINNDLYYSSTNGTKKELGTGFGLKLCKDFAKLNDGKIRFISSDSGTIVDLILPNNISSQSHIK